MLGPQDLQRYDGIRFRSYVGIVSDSLQRTLIVVTNYHVDSEGWIWLVPPAGRPALRSDPIAEQVEVRKGPVVLPTSGTVQRICTNIFPYYNVLHPLGVPEEIRRQVTSARGNDDLRAIQRTVRMTGCA